MKKYKGYVFSHEYPPRLGGAGGVAKELTEALNLAGVETDVVTSYKSSLFDFIRAKIIVEKNNEFKIIRIPVFQGLWFLSYPIFISNVITKDSTFVIFNDFGAAYCNYLRPNIFRNLKKILYIHGKEKYLHENGFIKQFLLKFRTSFLFNIENSDVTICVSDFIKRWLDNEVPSFAKEKSAIITNCVDKRIFYNSGSESVFTFFDGKYEILLTVSRFVKMKGFDKMLDLFESLLNKNNNFRWVIVGDGDYKSDFESKIKRKKLESYIKCVGKVDRNELHKYYSSSDCFLLLSEYEEAYPLVYHEAQCCELPVVGINRGGVKEVIDNGVNGFVVENYDEAYKIIIHHKYKELNMKAAASSIDGLDVFSKKILNILK